MCIRDRYREEGFPVTIVRPSHTYCGGKAVVALHGARGCWQTLALSLIHIWIPPMWYLSTVIFKYSSVREEPMLKNSWPIFSSSDIEAMVSSTPVSYTHLTDDGREQVKEVSEAELARIRLARARELDEERYKDE